MVHNVIISLMNKECNLNLQSMNRNHRHSRHQNPPAKKPEEKKPEKKDPWWKWPLIIFIGLLFLNSLANPPQPPRSGPVPVQVQRHVWVYTPTGQELRLVVNEGGTEVVLGPREVIGPISTRVTTLLSPQPPERRYTIINTQ